MAKSLGFKHQGADCAHNNLDGVNQGISLAVELEPRLCASTHKNEHLLKILSEPFHNVDAGLCLFGRG